MVIPIEAIGFFLVLFLICYLIVVLDEKFRKSNTSPNEERVEDRIKELETDLAYYNDQLQGCYGLDWDTDEQIDSLSREVNKLDIKIKEIEYELSLLKSRLS